MNKGIPEYIPNHVERAVAELIPRLDKPRLRAFVHILAASVQELEATLFALIVERRLDVATGRNLDVYGRVVGLRRDGLPDSVFRLFIRAKILANASQGEIPRIKRYVQIVTGGESRLVVYHTAFPAAYRLSYVVDVPTLAVHRERLKAQVADMTNCGVGVEAIIEARTGFFGFSDNPDALGFGVGTFAEVI